jgi:hypothetical protein
MTTEIIEIQKEIHSIFDSTKVEALVRKGYEGDMEDMVLMKQICDNLTAMRQRNLIWYEDEWNYTLKETLTFTTDQYILSLLVSVDIDWITNYNFPSTDIAERMKKSDAGKLNKVMQGIYCAES